MGQDHLLDFLSRPRKSSKVLENFDRSKPLMCGLKIFWSLGGGKKVSNENVSGDKIRH